MSDPKLPDIQNYEGVWVLIEQESGLINQVSWELLGESRKLRDDLECSLTAVLFGDNVGHLTAEIFARGADKLILIDNPVFAEYRTYPYSKALSKLIDLYKPDVLLLGATTVGRDLASPVATEVGTGLTADCTQLRIDPETKLLQQTRPAFGGNVMATILCKKTRPQMATVRPGIFPILEPDYSLAGETIHESLEITEDEIPTQIMEFIPDDRSSEVKLEKAQVIVSGGRGMACADNFELLRDLADVLGGEIGCSRPVVDMGWLPYEHQVGQTGKSVRPKLYIAAGISGAVQHQAGMKNAKTIIAINKDPQAPIFKIATFGIVGDLLEIVPFLTEEVKKRLDKNSVPANKA